MKPRPFTIGENQRKIPDQIQVFLLIIVINMRKMNAWSDFGRRRPRRNYIKQFKLFSFSSFFRIRFEYHDQVKSLREQIGNKSQSVENLKNGGKKIKVRNELTDDFCRSKDVRRNV